MSMNEIQQKLCEDNINLAYYIVSQYYPTYIHDDDVKASALLGLCKAAESYDPEKGLFSTYAGKCIRNEINQEFINRKPYSKMVSLESKIGEELTLGDMLISDDDIFCMDEMFYDTLTKEERDVLEVENMGFSTDEIAEMFGYSVQKVQKLLRMTRKKWRKYNGD